MVLRKIHTSTTISLPNVIKDVPEVSDLVMIDFLFTVCIGTVNHRK